MKALSHNVLPAIGFKDGARTAAANGDAIIDLAGFEGALIVIASGTITDGTSYEFELKEGDNSALSDAAAVADGDLVAGGPASADKEPTFLAADDDHIHWFSYIGSKRYIRIDLKTVVGSPATGGHFMGQVLKGFPRHAPVV